ncbi:MAG: tetratricopeptide repeat protein, partial [Nannocystaceae bacterium]|nr:tetratricopeptide repeat protein [Nannocystaceae bacterium]
EALRRAGRPAAALARLPALREAAVRLDHPPLLGRIELSEAQALSDDGRWVEAIPLSKQVAWRAHATHDDVLECEASLSTLTSLAAERRFDEFAEWQAHAEADVARLPEATAAPLRLRLLSTLANLAYVREDFEAARRGYVEAQELCARVQPPEGCTNLVSHLADVAAAAGDLHEAEQLFEQALQEQRMRFGEDHPSTALRIAAVATVQRKLGALTQARANFDRAIAILAAIDPRQADIAAIKNNRAVVELFLGDLPAAERDFQAALDDRRERSHGTDPLLPALEGNLGMVVYAQGDFSRALTLHQRSLAGTIAVYGEQNLDVANALANIGDVLSELQLPDQAQSYFRRALEIRTAVVGADHPDTARTHCNLGGVALALAQQDDVLAQYQRCHDGYVRVFGSAHAQLAMPEAGLGEVHLAMGHVDEALVHLRRARALVGDDAQLERARIDWALARAVGMTDPGQARALARAALAELERQGALARGDAAAARRWLRTHGG